MLEEGKILGRLHKLRAEADYGVERGYAAGELREELQNLSRFRGAVDRVLASLALMPLEGD